MNTVSEHAEFANIRQQIHAEIDKQWQEEGALPEELEISRRLSDLFACELAAGRVPAEIEADWEGKSSEEILQQYALPVPLANNCPTPA